MHIQNLVNFYPFILQILSGNKILISIKGHKSVTNLQKMTANNPNLDLVNMNSNITLGQILSISQNSDKNKGHKSRAITLL